MRRRWRVQATLLEGPSEPYDYAPSWHRWQWQARRQVRELRRSFPPEAVRIAMVLVPRGQRDEPRPLRIGRRQT